MSRHPAGMGPDEPEAGLLARGAPSAEPPADAVQARPAAPTRPDLTHMNPFAPHTMTLTEARVVQAMKAEAEAAPATVSLEEATATLVRLVKEVQRDIRDTLFAKADAVMPEDVEQAEAIVEATQARLSDDG